MKSYTISEASANLHKIMDNPSGLNKPILIKGKKHSAVLLSEKDYTGLQETLYISSIPGLKESILATRKEKPGKLINKLDWNNV